METRAAVSTPDGPMNSLVPYPCSCFHLRLLPTASCLLVARVLPESLRVLCGYLTPSIPRSTYHCRYLTRGLGKMCDAAVDEWYPWPTCEMHYDLATGYSDFYSWVWYSLYDPHGPVHIWIGGVLDCEETFAAIAKLVGPSIAEDLALYSFIHRKNLFREGIFSCVGSASVAQAPAEVS